MQNTRGCFRPYHNDKKQGTKQEDNFLASIKPNFRLLIEELFPIDPRFDKRISPQSMFIHNRVSWGLFSFLGFRLHEVNYLLFCRFLDLRRFFLSSTSSPRGGGKTSHGFWCNTYLLCSTWIYGKCSVESWKFGSGEFTSSASKTFPENYEQNSACWTRGIRCPIVLRRYIHRSRTSGSQGELF